MRRSFDDMLDYGNSTQEETTRVQCDLCRSVILFPGMMTKRVEWIFKGLCRAALAPGCLSTLR